jgi:hypothetical protein
MISMTRNSAAGSNVNNPPSSTGTYSVQFYEQIYNTTGPQEWITLPDSGQSKIVVSFPKGSGSAFLEGTSSPAPLLQGIGKSPLGAYSPVIYQLTDDVTEITPVLVNGETAIRVNCLSGPVAISVRC